MLRILFLTAVFAFTASGDAVTWKVARESGDDAKAAADATGATAFQSIQAAVDKAASGDTILVGPGVYDNVTATDSKTSVNRVYITGKKLTLKSTAGAAKTHIVGRWDTSSASTNGCGKAQIRCVCVNSDCGGTVIEGFTLRDGATRLDRTASGVLNEDIPQLGGGLAVYSQKKDVYLVDCVVSNCTAWMGGGMRGGTAVRCLITGNHSYGSPAGVRQANLYACLVVRNFDQGAASCPIAVNCTFGENALNACGFTHAYNCLYACGATTSGNVYKYVSENSSGPQLFAPMARDYRLLTGSVAATAGDAAYLTTAIADLPAEYVGKDFFGNSFPTEGGVTVAGAVAEQVTPLHGGIMFNSAVDCGGETIPNATYAFYDTWPQQVCVKPVVAAGKTFFRYGVSGANNESGATSRWLQKDGSLWIVPPYAAGAMMTNTAVLASRILWADANYAGGDSDGTTNRPFATLKDAVAAVTDNNASIIYLQEGDYNRGEDYSSSHSNRVTIAGSRQILLKAVGRVEKTVIRGRAASPACQQQPTYYPGCGTDAVRCLCINSTAGSAVQGVTLADGFSNCNNYTVDDSHDRGGGIAGPSTTAYGYAQALDCVFTNCAAVRCGVFFGVWTSRCKIYDCHGYGGVTRYSVLSSTYVDRSNKANEGITVPNATLNNVVGTSTIGVHMTMDYPSGASNRGADQKYQLANVAQRFSFSGGIPYYGTVARSAYTAPTAFGYTHAAPTFIDENNGDFRQLSTSCCACGGGAFADDGNAQYATAMSYYATYATTDMDGNPIRFKDGVPTPGAYQVPVAALTTTVSSGSLSVNGSTAATTNRMPDTVTVRVEKGTRPLVGFAVNGTEYVYDGSCSSWIFSAADYPADQTFAVTPILGTNWYVNASRPDDTGDGFTPTTAKRTFHGEGGVMEKVQDGDCVHADAGVYDEGYAVPCKVLRRRLVVPAGVTVVADKGPEDTFIVGAPATETGVEGYEVDEWGRGTNAVACVYLKSTTSKRATVRGFTLTGGRTHRIYGLQIASSLWSDECIGGAALAAQAYDQAFNGRVENCIVSNNVSCRGGAFNQVYAINCRVFGNAAESGSASACAFQQGCVVDHCRGGNAIASPRSVWNCTVGSNNVNWAGDGWTWGISDRYGKDGGVLNTLCLGHASAITNANNSLFAESSQTTVDFNDTRIVNCRMLPADELAVDTSYAPVIGSNDAVDRGDMTLGDYDLFGGRDACGNPRAVNGGRMDIGAVETPWLGRYASDIVPSHRFSVTAADAAVVETDARAVSIPSGKALSAQWVRNGKSCEYVLVVRLPATGTGALEIYLNDAAFKTVTAPGETTLRFANALAVNKLDFAYAGDGAAEIVSSRCEGGFTLFLR